jgi:palmitoyltransferase
MSILGKIAIAVAVISFITFVALFGQLPALRKTPIGWLQRVLCLHIPNGLRTVDRLATGGRITSKSRRLGQYLFYEKNPVVLVCTFSSIRNSRMVILRRHVDIVPLSYYRKRCALSLIRDSVAANKSHTSGESSLTGPLLLDFHSH